MSFIATLQPRGTSAARGPGYFDWADPRWNIGAGNTAGSDAAIDAILAAARALPAATPKFHDLSRLGATVWVNDPIVIDTDNTVVRGVRTGNAPTLAACFGRHNPVLLLGYKDSYNGGAGNPWNFSFNAATHWVDLYGHLDSSVAPSAGRYYGLNLNGDAFVACHGHVWTDPPNLVNGWDGYGGMAIALAVDSVLLSGGTVGFDALCGAFDGQRVPQPVLLRISADNQLQLLWRCAEQPNLAYYNATWPLAAVSGTPAAIRLVVQLNCDAGTATAWYDQGLGTAQLRQLAPPSITTGGNGRGPAFAAGMTLGGDGQNTARSHPLCPFMIGAMVSDGNAGTPPGMAGSSVPAARKIYGLNVYAWQRVGPLSTSPTPGSTSTLPPFREQTTGTLITNQAGATNLNDAALVNNTGALTSMFNLVYDSRAYNTGPTLGRYNGRFVRFWCNAGGFGGAGFGHWMMSAQQSSATAQVNSTVVQDLTLAGAIYGQVLSVGNLWDMHLQNLDISGGRQMLGSYGNSGIWNSSIRDIGFNGSANWGVGIALEQYYGTISDCHYAVRDPVRLRGSSATLQGLQFCAGIMESTESYVYLHGDSNWGGLYSISGFQGDSEVVNSGPLRACIVAEHPINGSPMQLDVGRCSFGGRIGPYAGAVELVTNNSSLNRCGATILGPMIQQAGASDNACTGGLVKGNDVYTADGSGGVWDATLVECANGTQTELPQGFTMGACPSAGGADRIEVEHIRLSIPPQANQYDGGYMGWHRFKARRRVAGAPDEFRTAQPGRYTANTPRPRWRFDPNDVLAPAGTELAAWPVPTDYATLNSAGDKPRTLRRAGEGWWSSRVRAFVLGHYLGGTQMPMPSSLVLATALTQFYYEVMYNATTLPGAGSGLQFFPALAGASRSVGASTGPAFTWDATTLQRTQSPVRGWTIADNTGGTLTAYLCFSAECPTHLDKHLPYSLKCLSYTFPVGAFAVGDSFGSNTPLSVPGTGYLDEGTSCWTTPYLQAIVNNFLRGTAPGLPAGVFLGLSTTAANAAGTVSEPDGGYARVNVGPTSNSGTPMFAVRPPTPTGNPAYGNQQALTFDCSASTTGPVLSCFLGTSGTPGNADVMWMCNLITPRTGKVLTFAPWSCWVNF